jgi:histidine triad (HIT) family protein
MEAPCIFCQIIARKLPAKVVYEDEEVVAFLDKMPRSKGMTLVVPKKHYKEFDEDFDASARLLAVALKVGKMVKDALQPKFVSIALIPSPKIPHIHVRIYPFYEDQVPLGEASPIEMSDSELEEVAEKIRSIEVELEEEVEKEEEKEEVEERSPEEIYWIRREIEMA